MNTYFNPRPPCGRRRPGQHAQDRRGNISTHVPRAGDDPGIDRIRRQCGHFNPRPPCGRRRALGYVVQMCKVFQPTSPVRETTTCGSPARPVQLISTHVPRAGDDGQYFTNEYRNPNFNPRPPCGRRPLSPEDDTIGDSAFQPTSPVRETTKSNGKARQHFYDFNPRPPCGRRQHNGRLHMTEIIFQPTSPVRETTKLG